MSKTSKKKTNQPKSGGPTTKAKTSAYRPPGGHSKLKQYLLLGVFLTILIGVPTAYYLYYMPVEVVNIPFRQIHVYPRANDAFTQGLYYEKGILYESTGNPNHGVRNDKPDQSWIRKINLKTGQIDRQVLEKKYFAEGLTIFNNRIYQLTWENNVIFVYDRELNRIDRFDYAGEGWGITSDGEYLIISNGSDLLRFLDPDTMDEKKIIAVKNGNRGVPNLNELEYVDGKIYANVWQRDIIVEIDPESGQVTGEIDLSKLWPVDQREHNLGAVFNGIAYNPETGHFYVTGKYCPNVFEIKLIR